MATLQGGRDGTYLRIDSITSVNPNWRGDVYFRDKDGADIHIMSDVLSHLISVVSHEMKCETVEELLKKLCTCAVTPP